MIPKAERERGDRLRAYCDGFAGKPIEWGVDDCSPFAAQWLANETGRHVPIPDYDSREGARAIIEAEGGLPAIWERMAAGAGLVECAELPPPVGSVGLIQTRLRGPVGGVFLFGGIFLWRHESGVRIMPARPNTIIKAWLAP